MVCRITLGGSFILEDEEYEARYATFKGTGARAVLWIILVKRRSDIAV